MPKTKSILLQNQLLGKEGQRSTTGFSASNQYSGVIHNENTECYGNGNYRWQDPGLRDRGDSWLLVRDQLILPRTTAYTVVNRTALPRREYQGSFVLNGPINPGLPSSYKPDAWGAEAYDRMKPTKPSFDGLNAVAELREVGNLVNLHRVKNGFTQGIRTAGNYWLALKFGWEPLLRDVRGLIRAQRTVQKRLAQLLRDNGKPVRRSVRVADYSTEETVPLSGSANFKPTLDTTYYRKEATGVETRTFKDEVWASARFRYWLPGGPRDMVWTNKMIAYIFGLYPTPEVVYNYMPWTWLLDWFTNLGDIISNLDTGVADRLAADYFYVMRHTGNIRHRDMTAYMKGPTGSNVDVRATSTWTRERKTRAKGDPFGFATEETMLNGHQLGIMGALGMSRLR